MKLLKPIAALYNVMNGGTQFLRKMTEILNNLSERKDNTSNITLLVLSVLTAIALMNVRDWNHEKDDVAKWLERNNLSYISDVVTKAGGMSLHDALNVMKNIQKNRKLYRALTKEQLSLLERAVRRLRDELELEMWLEDMRLGHYMHVFQENGVLSLRDLTKLEDSELDEMLSLKGYHRDENLSSHVALLSQDIQEGVKVTDNKAFLDFVKNKSHSRLKDLCFKIGACASPQY